MSYTFPFYKGQKVVELGGGTKPYFRPNLDVRAAENVDIVADLNETLPLDDDEYEGVFSSFCIEHLSWRKVRSFIAECFRIISPGSKAVFITANTEEQMKYVLAHDEWTDDCSCIIFGDQDYPENAHRNSLCPRHAIKLFREAGFENIIVFPFGNLKTDMIIEATKPLTVKVSSMSKLFDKNYYDNALYFGNLNEGIYRDHPKNWIAFKKIMELQPESVLELGCGRGYMLKRLEAHGVPCKGVDVSDHCLVTRATDAVLKFDFLDTPWPAQDGEFDLCLSIEALEYVPENKLQDVIDEIKRVCKRSFHAVNTKEDDLSFGKPVKLLKPKDWWENKLGVKNVVSTKELHTGSVALSLPEPDNKLKLNIGTFTNMAHYGWLNLDIVQLHDYAKANLYKFIHMDATQTMRLNNESVDLMATSHMLEHLNYNEGLHFLKDCFRVLKPGGVIRIAVPDGEKMMRMYLEKKLDVFDDVNQNCAKNKSQAVKLWSVLIDQHKIIYDWETLKQIGEEAGFVVERRAFNQGHQQIINEVVDMLPDESIFVEMIKKS